MKKLLLILLLLPFVFSCSDDKDDNTSWNKDVVGLSFKGKVDGDYTLSFSLHDKNVYITAVRSVHRVSKWFTYSKTDLPDNRVKITIPEVSAIGSESFDFTGIIDNTGKTMIHIGADGTIINMDGTSMYVNDSTIFYRY